MKIVQLFSGYAERAASRYDMLVESWRGLYEGAFTEPDFGTPRQLTRVRSQAYDMARRFLENEAVAISEASDTVAREARTATIDELESIDTRELTDAASELVSDNASYLRSEIAIQIERDIAHLVSTLRRVILQINLSARSQGVSPRAAVIQHRLGSADTLKFFFYDRSSAKWPSRRFVRAIWRQHLLSTYNEVVLATLADHGVTSAKVESVNRGHVAHGMIIAMSPGSQHPTYSEIRAEIFHPNADAILKRAF